MVKEFCLGGGSVGELAQLGTILDGHAPAPQKTTMGVFLAEALLRVRDRRGKRVPLKPNRAQSEYERRRGQSNIILKARQMGISTWVAGRFFLKTITHAGTADGAGGAYAAGSREDLSLCPPLSPRIAGCAAQRGASHGPG